MDMMNSAGKVKIHVVVNEGLKP